MRLLGAASAQLSTHFNLVEGLEGVFGGDSDNSYALGDNVAADCPGQRYGQFSDAVAAPDGKTLIYIPMESYNIGIFEPATSKCARGVLPPNGQRPIHLAVSPRPSPTSSAARVAPAAAQLGVGANRVNGPLLFTSAPSGHLWGPGSLSDAKNQ